MYRYPPNRFAGILTACLLVLCSFEIYSQKLTVAPAEQVGMSTERLARIDAAIGDYVRKGQIAGAIALIARDGKIVYHKGIGYDDLPHKTPLNKEAIMRIASQTKAITSVGVMMLYEEGKFLLDEPISNYIATFKNPKVVDSFNEKDSTYTTKPASREVTIRHLLTHTSGIDYPAIGSKEAGAIYAKNGISTGLGSRDAVLSETITRLGTMPLFHQPGETFTYGLNTDVLGYLIEIISGKPLDLFFEERVFGPLGMKDTYFFIPPAKASRLAKLYTQDGAGNTVLQTTENWILPQLKGVSPDFHLQKGKFLSGGGGLSSTAFDYAVFLQMLLNGGKYNGKQLLSPTTITLMTQNQIGELSLKQNPFGLGFGLVNAKQAARLPVSEGSYDWGGMFGTSYWVDPVEGIIGIFMIQKFPNTTAKGLTDKFKVLTYQAITQKKK